MKKQNVLIVGGGFGGLKAALCLSADEHFKVTLVSDQADFRYYPALYHTATGGASQVSSIPLNELLADHNITYHRARAVHLKRDTKQLVTKGAGTLHYDSLILSLGMTTNYFGIKGLEQYSFGIKSLDEAEELKQHIHTQLRRTGAVDQHYLIVGGGPTGVELAGVLPGYIKQAMKRHGLPDRAVHVELIEAMPRIMPRMTKDVSRATTKRLRKLGVIVRTNQKVEAETADALIVNGQPVTSHTVVWTAGVACNQFFQDNGFTMTPRHKVEVNQYLQAEPDIYVLGDNADTMYSGVAQTALHDAVTVSRNLQRLVRGKQPKPYRRRKPIYVTPTGPGWASVVYGTFRIYGRLGWWLREAADFVAYRDYEPWWPAVQRWRALHDSQESCPLCGQ